jgi:hypothetical protein
MPVDKLIRLTGEQISRINPDQVGSWGNSFWDAIPVHLLARVAGESIQKAGYLPSLNITELEYMVSIFL